MTRKLTVTDEKKTSGPFKVKSNTTEKIKLL